MSVVKERRAGILVPLFSIPSSRSWGIGEIGDIAGTAAWLASAGQRVLQLLPVTEMPPGETSPYSALSAMAIGPHYLSLDAVEDFQAAGGERSLASGERDRLEAARGTGRVDYAEVSDLKVIVLRRAFARFRDVEWQGRTARASALGAFVREQAWWLDDYALFRALHARFDERPWTAWPGPLAAREPAALDAARRDLAEEILFRQYLQWLASEQWGAARRAAPIQLFGDLPFMVSADSADVWARQDEFRLDVSVGVPPDAFSATGQDWGLPVYRWDVLAARDFAWLRDRARRSADLFDGYRVDHLVGFYRTCYRPHAGGEPRFTPEDEASQRALGERVLTIFQEPGAEITAEDLGVIPPFVRESLARLGVPGYRVFRWEREWDAPGQPFRDPVDYPAASVATSGTHDTEPMVVWWEQATRAEREAVMAIPSMRARLSEEARAAAIEAPAMPRAVLHACLDVLAASGADLLVLPMQDVFGWRDRINEPATVNTVNWTWRLPWPSDRLAAEPEAAAAAARMREYARRGRRVL